MQATNRPSLRPFAASSAHNLAFPSNPTTRAGQRDNRDDLRPGYTPMLRTHSQPDHGVRLDRQYSWHSPVLPLLIVVHYL